MTKREELEQTIRNLQNALNKVQEDLKNLNNCEKFVPKDDEGYWFIDDEGDILCDSNDDATDKNRIDFYNCFRTEKEAKYEKEKILVRRMLENIANRLNEGKEIDWYNNKKKFFISYDRDEGVLCCTNTVNLQIAGVVYCIGFKFLEVAKEEIGEERLIKYVKGE